MLTNGREKKESIASDYTDVIESQFSTNKCFFSACKLRKIQIKVIT